MKRVGGECAVSRQAYSSKTKDVTQRRRASCLGPQGRRFESSHPDWRGQPEGSSVRLRPRCDRRMGNLAMADDRRELVARCARGDPAAWETLVREFSGLVFAVARSTGLPRESCEDVAQATFAALAKSITTINDAKALPAWLTITARREAVRVRRAAARGSASAIPGDVADEPSDAAETLARIERHHHLRDAMAVLDPRCRSLIDALYFRSPPAAYQAVSDSLGIPIGSIGPTRLRCLAKLAELMRDREG